MQIRINRFAGFHANRAGLSLLAGTPSDLSAKNSLLRQKCRLILNEKEYIFCTITHVRKNTDSHSLMLQMDNTLKNIKAINLYIYRDDLSFALLIQENVEQSVYVEAQSLLRQLAQKTGKEEADILYELTSFENVRGKRDLKFVSQKQMLVVIDKIKKQLYGGKIENCTS